MTQGELAEIINRSFESVNADCANRRQPSLQLLYEISSAMNCPVKDLLEDNNKLKKK
jgi:DNA-binding XRE family transcriptional regulator